VFLKSQHSFKIFSSNIFCVKVGRNLPIDDNQEMYMDMKNRKGTGINTVNQNESDQLPNQNLAKAVQILDMFSLKRPEWGIRELGRELGINPSTVYRLVTTLYQAGYLERNADTQLYSLGPMVLKLANLYTHFNPLPALARKVFESYAHRFGYNYYLGSLVHYEIVYLAVLDGQGPIKIVVEPGGTTAIHTTAIGKVLLAFKPDEFIRQFLDKSELKQYTSRSISDPDRLWEQIQLIRQQGYAINDGEHYDEVGSVGVPTRDSRGCVSLAVSLAYPRHLIYEKCLMLDELIALAKEVANEIEMRIGSVHSHAD
jgi:DNA-binding IclR family transcriptional regulator